VESLKSKVTGAKDSVADATRAAARSSTRPGGRSQENPLGLVIGAAAIGFVAGMLIPSIRVEDENIGPVSDQVTAKAAETGHQALDRGKQVASDVASSAAETAKASRREQAQGAADDARQAAQETREEVRSS